MQTNTYRFYSKNDLHSNSFEELNEFENFNLKNTPIIIGVMESAWYTVGSTKYYISSNPIKFQ